MQLPAPKPPNQEMLSSSSVDERSNDESVQLSDLESKSKPMPFSQKALNDLCRDLYLTKDKSELLASRRKERNLLEEGVKITLHRKHAQNLCLPLKMVHASAMTLLNFSSDWKYHMITPTGDFF